MERKPAKKQPVKSTKKPYGSTVAKNTATKVPRKVTSKKETTKPKSEKPRSKASQKGGQFSSNEEVLAATNQYCKSFNDFYITTIRCSLDNIEERQKCVQDFVKRENMSRRNAKCSTNILDILQILKDQEQKNTQRTVNETKYTSLRDKIIAELNEYSLLTQLNEEQNNNGKRARAGGRNNSKKPERPLKKYTIKRKGGATPTQDDELDQCLFDVSVLRNFDNKSLDYNDPKLYERARKNIQLCADDKYGKEDGHSLIKLWYDKIFTGTKTERNIIDMYIAKVETDTVFGSNSTSEQSCHRHNSNILKMMNEIDYEMTNISDKIYDDVKNKILKRYEENYDVYYDINIYVGNLVYNFKKEQAKQNLLDEHEKKMKAILNNYNRYNKVKDGDDDEKKQQKAWKFLKGFKKYLMDGNGVNSKTYYENYYHILPVEQWIINEYKEVQNKYPPMIVVKNKDGTEQNVTENKLTENPELSGYFKIVESAQ